VTAMGTAPAPQRDTVRVAVYGTARPDALAAGREAARAGGFELVGASDVDAAEGIASGRFAWAIGTCITGRGAALAIARARLGEAGVAWLAGPGRPADRDGIAAAAHSGARVFGIADTAVERAVPWLLAALAGARP